MAAIIKCYSQSTIVAAATVQALCAPTPVSSITGPRLCIAKLLAIDGDHLSSLAQVDLEEGELEMSTQAAVNDR